MKQYHYCPIKIQKCSLKYLKFSYLAVGGNFTQIWDINKITALASGEASMYVDYVRLYQGLEPNEEYNGPRLSSIVEKKSQNENSYFLYPNPSSDYADVSGEKSVRKIEFISLTGNRVISTFDNPIDVSGLSNGYYIVKIEDIHNNIESHPFIKQ